VKHNSPIHCIKVCDSKSYSVIKENIWRFNQEHEEHQERVLDHSTCKENLNQSQIALNALEMLNSIVSILNMFIYFI
jgi:hypothetical protein